MRQRAALKRTLPSLPQIAAAARLPTVMVACGLAVLVAATAAILYIISTDPGTPLQAGVRGRGVCALVFACALLLGMAIASTFEALTIRAETAECARQRLESDVASRAAELQATNERLRESEARYRAYFEHTAESLFVVQVTADGRFVYEELNPAHERAIGISNEALSGKAPHELLAPDVADGLVVNYRRCVEAGRPIRYEETVRLPGGERRWETSLAPLRDSSGRICLILGSARDITEHEQAAHMLRRLAGEVLCSQDQERRRIARDLHDSTAQNLVAATLCLAGMQHLVDTGQEIDASVAEAQALVNQSLQEVRTLSYLLHPPALEEAGLVSALQWFVSGYEKRTGVRVKLSIPTDIDRPPPDIESALFRIVQEGLTNVHRHSGSATAQIRLRQQDGSMALEIRDQGTGMTAGADDGVFHDVARLGVGIPGMRLRLRQFGGELNIRSSGRGTVVRAIVPLSGNLRGVIGDPTESMNRRTVGRAMRSA